jgi:hypothetical protein
MPANTFTTRKKQRRQTWSKWVSLSPKHREIPAKIGFVL